MENLQNQNNQSLNQDMQKAIEESIEQTLDLPNRESDTIDKNEEDTAAGSQTSIELNPTEGKDPLVMFKLDRPAIAQPKKKSVLRKYTEQECYENPGKMLKFKHDKRGEHRFFVSLWGKDMTFYFSFIEFEEHRQSHEGNYTHHKFREFEDAIQFYSKRMSRYSHKHTVQELRKEYALFRDPHWANQITMTW